MDKILTIVIPAYNSEKLLPKVLDSLMVPSVLPEMDIIVVNDGSRDRTAEVTMEYCRKWPGSIRLISQPNKGHGGALNTGIAAAEGKYVKVIDSDDWVETDNLPRFISYLSRCSCDAVLTHFNTFNISDHTVTQWRSYPRHFNRTYSLQEVIEDWGSFNQITAFHGITYRTDFYRSTGVQLSEHVYYEDQEYCIIPFSQIRTVMPLDLVIYNYRVGDSGQSMSEASLQKNASHFKTVINKLIESYSDLPMEEDSPGREYYCRMVKSLLVSYLITVMLMNPNRREGRRRGAEIMKAIRSRIPSVYRYAVMPYHALRVMNYLRISKSTCDALLCSKLYTRLRYKRDLNISSRQAVHSEAR